MLSSTFTKKTQGLIKSVTQKVDHYFGKCGRCVCVSPCSVGSDCEFTILPAHFVVSERFYSYVEVCRRGCKCYQPTYQCCSPISRCCSLAMRTEVLQYPPCSPDLIPSGYDVIPRLKQQFVNLWEIFKLGAK
jgi:hypothetical protein